MAAEKAAILDRSSAWRPTVCIGRGGGMAPAEQRNAAYSLTPLPTRLLKEADMTYFINTNQMTFNKEVPCDEVDALFW
jgi:hypothetical protein